MKNILAAVRDLIEWGAEHSHETREECSLLLSRVNWEGDLRQPEPKLLPFVEGNLRQACSLSGPDGSLTHNLAHAVLKDAHHLRWHDMYASYDDEPDVAAFRRVYGYFDLISPQGPLPCEDIYMGMSLQGPDAFYPPHAHKAVETYVTIGGTGDWKRGAEPWVSRAPGEFFLHTSGIRHATQSNDQTLLALAFWTSALDCPCVIVRG